ncbi:MAG: histidine phosphatase family protein [Rhodobacteraceae bacterium]|nr:histidine phosphatase family protein [Paracoccaceae bacterium]
MTGIFLVRHGPTHVKAMLGWSDLPADLSDQAALDRLSAALPAEALIISSDLTRAADTATAIQGTRRRLPHDSDLREIHFGAWELRPFKEIEAQDPDRIRAYWEQPGDVRPPGGESWNEVRARVDRSVDRLRTAHPEADLVIVAHFSVILTQLQRALEIDAYDVFAHRIDNLSVAEIHHTDAGWQVIRINHTP